MGEEAEEPLDDLGLIAAAQRVEHYEISAYGTARTMAEELGQDQVASLLSETEEEEKNADSRLNEVAASLLEQAKNMGEESEMEEEGEEEQTPRRKPSSQPRKQKRAQRA